jgi:hypothetical protein
MRGVSNRLSVWLILNEITENTTEKLVHMYLYDMNDEFTAEKILERVFFKIEIVLYHNEKW